MDEKEAEARPVMGTIFLVIQLLLVGFYRPILTLSMRAFGPRISAYALDHDS